MTENKKLNTQALSLKIKDNEEDQLIIKEKVGSILFACVTEKDGDAHNIKAGMVGSFSLKSIAQSLESITTASAQALKEHHDFTPSDFISLMAAISSEVLDTVFEDDINDAVAKALVKKIKASSKN